MTIYIHTLTEGKQFALLAAALNKKSHQIIEIIVFKSKTSGNKATLATTI